VRFTQRADAGPSTADSEPACATDEVQQLAHGSPSLLLNRQCDHVVKGRLAPPSGACDCVTLSSTAASPYQNPTKDVMSSTAFAQEQVSGPTLCAHLLLANLRIDHAAEAPTAAALDAAAADTSAPRVRLPSAVAMPS
jgi:hypothetical protein